MKIRLNTTMPFSAIGIAFIIIGIILDDAAQLYFGFVWIFIAFIKVLFQIYKGHGLKDN